MSIEQVRIEYGGDTVVMTWDPAEQTAQIAVDGESTPHQTCSARHDKARAVRLVARYVWPECGDFAEGSDEWDDLAYQTLRTAEVQS